MKEMHLRATYLRGKAFRELFHVLIPKQLPDLSANGVDSPDHVGPIRRESLRVLHPNTIFTCYVVSFPMSDRLTD